MKAGTNRMAGPLAAWVLAALALLGGCRTTITGALRDDGGSALVGATVRAYDFRPTFNDLPAPARLIGQGATDAAGRFSISVPADADDVLLLADAPGKALGWTYVELDAEGKAEISLARAGGLAGRVVDIDGKPVPDVSVELILRTKDDRRGGWLHAGGGIAQLMTRTDEKGRFRFERAGVDCRGDFHVRAAGHGELATNFGREAPGHDVPADNIELKLPPEAVFEIDVVAADPAGSIDRAKLLASNFRSIWPRLGQAVPGRPGRLRWTGLPPGDYSVKIAQPAEGAADWAAKTLRVKAEAGRTLAEEKLEIARGGLAEIVMIDVETRRRVGRNWLGMQRTDHAASLHTRADAGGVARARLLPGEYKVLWVGGEKYMPAGAKPSFTVTDGQTVRVELLMKPKPVFAGVVLDPTGRPVAAAPVCVLPDWNYARSGADGRFEVRKDLDWWRMRTRFSIIARLPKRGLAGALDTPVDAAELKLHLAAATTLAGRVVDAKGAVAGADIDLALGEIFGDNLPRLGQLNTDSAGRYEIKALPAGRGYTLRFRARGRMTEELIVPAAKARPGRVELPTVTLPPAQRNAPAPTVRRIELPEIPNADAIWGAVGRDHRGHIWFGITISDKVDRPSAHLVEYNPSADKAYDRGDVISELKRCKAYRPGEGQLKIHSRICQAGDGHLYFVSMDEAGEEMETEVLPTWGGHLWRYRIAENRWEHLLTVPEGMLALAAGKRHVYALGYFGNVLYRYDTATGKSKRLRVGALDGHVTRNIFVDARDHVYVPRVRIDPARGRPVASLVQLDPQLKEVAETPLRGYLPGRPFNSHGITAFHRMRDGGALLVTHDGYLTRVRLQPGGPAKLELLGYPHPRGPAYVSTLFADAGGRRFFSVIQARRGRRQWLIYDLATRSASTAPFEIEDSRLDRGRDLLYGSGVRDNDGNCYVVGRHSLGRGKGHEPIVLKVTPAKGR